MGLPATKKYVILVNMSSKHRIYNQLIAKRAVLLFTAIILVLIGSLALIEHNRQSREEVAAANQDRYLYDVSIASPIHGQELSIEKGVDLLITVKGKDSASNLPEPEQIKFYNQDDFLGQAQEKVEVDSRVCQAQNEKCLIGNYLFKWTQENQSFPLLAGEYKDLHVIIQADSGRTVGASQPIELVIVSSKEPLAALKNEEVD